MARTTMLWCALAASFFLAACGAGHTSIGEVRAELLSVVGDVPGATGHRYQVVDDLGHSMGAVKIIQGPSSGLDVAVYAWADRPGPFTAIVVGLFIQRGEVDPAHGTVRLL